MNLVSEVPVKKYHIKQKCKEVERIIAFGSLDNEEKERIMTKVFMDHFGNGIETDEPVCWFNIERSRCNIQLLFSSVYIRFHKRPKPIDTQLSTVIKRVTLANFIFRYANPIGLILLEKIMFELS